MRSLTIYCFILLIAVSYGQFADFFTPFYNAMQESFQRQQAWSKAFSDAMREHPNGGPFEFEGPGGIPIKGSAVVVTLKPPLEGSFIQASGSIPSQSDDDATQFKASKATMTSRFRTESRSFDSNVDGVNTHSKEKTTVLGPLKCTEKTENGVRTFTCIES